MPRPRTLLALTLATLILAIGLAGCSNNTEQDHLETAEPTQTRTPVSTPTLKPGPSSTPTAAPTVTPTPTKEPFGQRFVRDKVAETISRVALEYDCRVDPDAIDVSNIVAPSLWQVFLTWAATWLLTDAELRESAKTAILDMDISPREFVQRIPECKP